MTATSLHAELMFHSDRISQNGRKWVWGAPFICFCLATGLYFSWRTRFLQVRFFKRMMTMLFQGKSSSSGISSFQAFSLALSGRSERVTSRELPRQSCWEVPALFSGCGLSIFSLGLLIPGVQSNAICEAVHHSFGIDQRITAGVTVLLLAMVIFSVYVDTLLVCTDRTGYFDNRSLPRIRFRATGSFQRSWNARIHYRLRTG